MTVFTQCYWCKNYIRGGSVNRCKAFPEKIPQDFLFNKIKHTKPYPGDNGIIYEPPIPEFKNFFDLSPEELVNAMEKLDKIQQAKKNNVSNKKGGEK